MMSENNQPSDVDEKRAPALTPELQHLVRCYSREGFNEAKRARVVLVRKLLDHGVSLRGIGRLLGYGASNIIRWIKIDDERLPLDRAQDQTTTTAATGSSSYMSKELQDSIEVKP